jgi:CheY-like chemotaxis protein
MMMHRSLDGQRLLVVEDEFLVALDMAQMIEERGGTVVGPAGNLDRAMALARSQMIDGAILDVNLDKRDSFPVADALLARGIPVVFATGYDGPLLPERFADTPKLAKPFTEAAVERTLSQAFGHH